MAEYPAVDLDASVRDGACDHGGCDQPGAVELAVSVILGSYPYEAAIRVYVVFESTPDVQEDVYTSAGGLTKGYLGTLEFPTPLSVSLRVRRLGGWPLGSMSIYVERS